MKYYDALNYKLLCMNVTNSLQLKELIINKKLNYMLHKMDEIGFASNMQSLLLSYREDASSRSYDLFTNPFQEVFGLSPTDQELTQSMPTTIDL